MKQFICSICNKEFKNQAALSGHARAHQEKSTHICPICGKQLVTHPGSFKQHVNFCQNRKGAASDFNTAAELYCKFCNRFCRSKNSLKQHQIRCKHNPDHIPIYTPENFNAKGLTPWNKDKTKETDERVAKMQRLLKSSMKRMRAHLQEKLILKKKNSI